jgi:hypothetical protein
MFVRQRDTKILKNQPEREYFILSGNKNMVTLIQKSTFREFLCAMRKKWMQTIHKKRDAL